jgi:hypothetical protein
LSSHFQLQLRSWTSADERRNVLLASAVSASLLLGLALIISGGWQLIVAILALVATPVLLYVLFAYERSWPYLLILAVHVTLFGARLTIGDINIRPNMLLAVLVSGLLLTRLVSGKVPRRQIAFLGLFLATNAVYLLSTLVNRSNPFFTKGIADCMLFLVNILQYGIIVWFFAADRTMFEKGMRLFLYCSTAFSAVYVVAFVLTQLGIEAVSNLLTDFKGENATSFSRFANLGTTEGTYLSFSVAVLLCLLVIFRRPLPWKGKWLALMLAANTGALALTFARGPWIAAVFGFLFVTGFAAVRYPVRELVGGALQSLLLLAVLFSAFGWFVLSRGDIMQMFAGRLENLTALEVGTFADRVLLWTQMWDDVSNAPILGHGGHNYAKFRDDPATQISENFVLELLHSAGVAVLIFLGATFLAVIRALRCVWHWRQAQEMPWLLPLAGGFIAMFLSSLTNPGMTGGFYWAALGLLVSSSQLARRPLAVPAASR